MAYNPGVSDISGQLRAQGMTRGMNSLLEGFDVGVKTYQQNKHIADTSIAKFGAAVSNSDALKALLTDEEQRSKLPSDVVKAYLKLNKEGSLGVREASLLGGFADSFLETEKAKQQQAYQAKMMQNVDQQIAASKQAGTLAQAQNAREQMAAGRAQGMYDRNAAAVENLRGIMGNADNLNAAVNPQFPADPDNGPASLGSYKDALGAPPLPVQAQTTSGSPFIQSPTSSIQVPNSPLRSGTTTPTPNVLVDYQNKMGNVPVAGNMGGAGVLTVQAADRIKRRAADLEDTSLGQMIRAGITPTDEMMGNSVLKDSTNQIAAARATAAAASKEAQNEFNARKIEIANARLQLAQDRADNKLDPFIKNLDDLLDLRRISPERHTELVDQWLTSKADARSDQAKLLAGVQDLIDPTGSKTKTATPPPKSRVLAPKGFVYMVDAKGQAGLVREENVEKAMTRGGRIL